MAYGILKCDNITFDNGGSDQNVTVSGLYRATTSGVTVSGTIVAATVSGVTIIGSTTVSGATVTGTTANFTSGNFSNIISSAATMSGALIIANQQQVQFREAVGNGVNHIALQAPAIVSADQTITLPDQTGTVVTTGDNGSVTSTMILDGTILNVDINASAAIAGTKISPDFGSQTIVTTGVHSAAAGSATTPSIAFTGDLNTGIYSPGADQVAISTNGTGRLFVDSTGLVGLGTSSPGASLDISPGAADTIYLTAPIASGAVSRNIGLFTPAGGSKDSSIDFGYIDRSNNFASTLTFRTSLDNSSRNVARMHIDSSGRVGIGTTSPGVKLQVNSGDIRIVQTDNSANNGLYFRNAADSATFAKVAYKAATGELEVGTTDAYSLLFLSNNTERMRLDSSGRLGLGTSSPSTLLDVAGTIGLTPGNADGIIRRTTVNGSNGIKIQGNTNDTVNDTNPGATIYAAGGLLTDGFEGNIILTAYGTTGSADRNTIRFRTRSGVDTTAERMRITSEGNVGIGTTSPAGALDVRTAGSAFQAYVGTNSGTSANDAGIVFQNVPSATASSRSCNLYFDANGADGSGGDYFYISNTGDNVASIWNQGGGPIVFGRVSTESLRIDSSGRLLVGTSSARSNIFDNIPVFQIESAGQAFASITGNLNNTGGSVLLLSKSRGGTVGGTTIVNNGDEIGQITFSASDGSALRPGAKITGEVDGTPGANDMPGRLVFSVTADGAASPTEALRISNDRSITVSDGGNVVLGTTTGTKIGTATTQKIGFYNATPVVQPTAVADATDAATVITQLNALLTRMRNLGLIAT